MCRAIWVMVVGSSAEDSRSLRRAAGPDAQVVAVASSGEEARDLIASTPADVIVVSADAPGARDLVGAARDNAAIVWVGADPPDGVHAAIPEAIDALESAITRALLAARAPK
ncbi:MAG: hypothetical protein ACXVQY_01080 [Actinomycetota bacterium]